MARNKSVLIELQQPQSCRNWVLQQRLAAKRRQALIRRKFFMSFAALTKLVVVAGAVLTVSGSSSLMIVINRQAAQFTPVSASLLDGPAIAVLKGNPTTGPSDMLLRIPRGAGRLHVHSADYRLVVVEGQMKHWAKGQTESAAELLGPGSFWFQPANEAHADSCLSDTCLMFINWSGKRDARLAD
jgi:hypothetical protein